MGNQQFEANESQTNITQYYQKMLNQNKENIPHQNQNTPKLLSAESRNKLRPTSKINLDMKLCSKSSEKSLHGVSQKMFQETPVVRNPLEKLHRKRSSTKIVQENDESHIQLLDLLKNMVRHQDSTMQSSQVKVSEQSCQEYDKKNLIIDSDQFYKPQIEDRPLQFNNRRRSKTFEESFRTLISNEDRCQPLNLYRRESKEEEALQFILQNCTQTQSRIDQQISNSVTFESLESDWQALTKKNSKQLETPGTAQFQGLNKDDKMFELSTSNFIEQNNDEIQGSRRPSCMESTFLIPMVLHSQVSLDFDDSKEVYQNSKPAQPYEYKKSQIPKMNGLLSQQQSLHQLNKLDCKINSTSRNVAQPMKKIIQTLASGLPNKAPFKQKSLHQQSEHSLSLPLQMINSKIGYRSNLSFVQNVPQSSLSSKNGRNQFDSKTFKTKPTVIIHPEEQWLANSKLEYKKIMLILDEQQQQQQQQIQNFSIQNKSEMISNTFNSSDINCSQRFQLDDLNFKLKPHLEDKNTQTQLKDLQQNLIDRLSQPKSRCSSRTAESNPYWKLREVDQSKRSRRK
ncbi:unnamed protein product [Paramecium octaurelia]|uniref:Uncharacterized protein n=1 Tax=Paramecium octaurelia TaxID=43137 RepID=A0A8S1Y7Y8_PAROT|nr:unnamed protein product [Paramecium octaurelia]